jgi:uncharacterized protein YhhL (DUF1145 family)
MDETTKPGCGREIEPTSALVQQYGDPRRQHVCILNLMTVIMQEVRMMLQKERVSNTSKREEKNIHIYIFIYMHT